MADLKKKLSENVDGDLFVDQSCENFGTCKELAPDLFTRLSQYHVVSKQPVSDKEKREALRAVLCCPKGAIGTRDRAELKSVFADFPLCIEDEVFYCGFNTPRSAGANSYFIKHANGNWLVSTPRFTPYLVEAFKSLGGLKYIFLSHRDDLGEAEKYRKELGAKVILHELELECCPDAELVIRGFEPQHLDEDFIVIPTPGHTEGHCVLLYRNHFLFSGDSLRYNMENDRVEDWDQYWTWYSYHEQARSLLKLDAFRFSWILCSHGGKVKKEPERLAFEIKSSAERALSAQADEICDERRIANLRYYGEEMRKLNQPLYASKIYRKAKLLEEELERELKAAAEPPGNSG